MAASITSSTPSTSALPLPPLRQSATSRKDSPVSSSLSTTSRPLPPKDTSYRIKERSRSCNSSLEQSLSDDPSPRENEHFRTCGEDAISRPDTPDPDEQLGKTAPAEKEMDSRKMIPSVLLSPSFIFARRLCTNSTAHKEATSLQDTDHGSKATKILDEDSGSGIYDSPTTEGDTNDECCPEYPRHELPSYDILRKAQDRLRDLLKSKRSLDFALEMELEDWRDDLYRRKSSLETDDKTTSQTADRKHTSNFNDFQVVVSLHRRERSAKELRGQGQRRKDSVLDTTDGELEVKDYHIKRSQDAHENTVEGVNTLADSGSASTPELIGLHKGKKDRKLKQNETTHKEHNDIAIQNEDKGVAREVAKQALVCAALNLIVWTLGLELGGHFVAMAIFMVWHAVVCD